MRKYLTALKWLNKLVPDLELETMTRMQYQQIINEYAKMHEKQTVIDFHHQLKSAILDAIDEGYLTKDPTRKVVLKGKIAKQKKQKYLNQYDLHNLLSVLNLGDKPSLDYLVLLVAKTGMRFSEALAVTPADFDFCRQLVSVSKTWSYKDNKTGGCFAPTKNESSIRKIPIDWQVVSQFSELVKDMPEDAPLFVEKKVYNSTVNDFLARKCKEAGVPVISMHCLRHTHASLLLFAGVSVASVSRRLGHSNITTTQKTYLHIIKELESQDVDLVMRTLASL